MNSIASVIGPSSLQMIQVAGQAVSSAQIALTVTAEQLPAGTYNNVITVSWGDNPITVDVTLTVTSPNPPPPPPPPPPPTTQLLLHAENLIYVGGFRVPQSAFPGSTGDTLMYCGTCPAYNPVNNSLFMVAGNNEIIEVSIPALVNSSNISDLNTAKILQWTTSVISRLPFNPSNVNTIGGLMVYGTGLLGTGYIYYDASDAQMGSHFFFNSTLSSAGMRGLYKVGTQNPGMVSGYMCPIPQEWQLALGAPYITGQADLSIISRTSAGPSAFGFDPSTLSYSTVTPAVPYCYYSANPLGAYEGTVCPVQNDCTQVNGIVFVPKTDTVLFFGSTATSLAGYGLANVWQPTSGQSSKGPVSLNNEYAVQVWAYNANDFVAAKNGAKTVDGGVLPYDVWNPTWPNTSLSKIGGVAYDQSNNLVYILVLNADNWFPLVQVFKIDTSVIATLPHVGTLSGMPQVPVSGTDDEQPIYYGTYVGPVKSGDPLLLTAGNVFSTANRSSISKVNFYCNGLLVGTSTASGINTSTYKCTMPTTGMTSGTYQITSVAIDSNGKSSIPTTWTLVIQ